MHNYSDSDDTESDGERHGAARQGGLAFEKEKRFVNANQATEFGDVVDNELDEGDGFQSEQQ